LSHARGSSKHQMEQATYNADSTSPNTSSKARVSVGPAVRGATDSRLSPKRRRSYARREPHHIPPATNRSRHQHRGPAARDAMCSDKQRGGRGHTGTVTRKADDTESNWTASGSRHIGSQPDAHAARGGTVGRPVSLLSRGVPSFRSEKWARRAKPVNPSSASTWRSRVARSNNFSSLRHLHPHCVIPDASLSAAHPPAILLLRALDL